MVTQRDIECTERVMLAMCAQADDHPSTAIAISELIAAHVAQETRAIRDIVEELITEAKQAMSDIKFMKHTVEQAVAMGGTIDGPSPTALQVRYDQIANRVKRWEAALANTANKQKEV